MIALDKDLRQMFDLTTDVMEKFTQLEISQICTYLIALKLWLRQIKESNDLLVAESRFK